MISIKKKKSKQGIKTKELENWFNDYSKKGYSPSQLRYALINNGLEKEASKLTQIHKNSSLKKTNLFLSLFVCILGVALLLSLIFILYPGKIILSGYFISEADLPGGALINVNFSNEVGVVREDFYGVNTWGINLDESDTWLRQMYLASGMNYIRADMSFEAYSTSESEFAESKLEESTRLVTWAKANNLKILWIADYMPPWLANTTSAEAKCSSNNMTCPPTNYTKWENMITNFLTEIGCDASVCEVEVWNEPDLAQFFLSNVGEDDGTNVSIRSKYYNLIYNSTYNAVKSIFPTMSVGGGGMANAQLSGNTIMKGFLSNFSNKMDFVSTHVYVTTTNENAGEDFSDIFPVRINNLLGNCSLYSANCSRIILGEFNYLNNNTLLTNQSYFNEFGSKFSLAYVYGLNNYPSNFSMVSYVWAGESDNRAMINTTDSSIYASYNITKYFSTYHPAGSTVIKSNSSSSNVKVVASKTQYITVINAGTSVNVGLNIFGEEVSQIKDIETNEIYNVTDGGVYIGNMSQYQIRYFVTLNNSVPVEEETEDPDNPNSGGGSGYRIVKEECENISLSGKTCVSLGYASGTLSYGPECTLDTSKCIPYVYDEENTVIAINFNGEITNGENESNRKNNNIEGNQKIFSSSGIILYSLVAGILVLLFFIARILIKIRKYNHSDYY